MERVAVDIFERPIKSLYATIWLWSKACSSYFINT
jgi:hypothetical protein